MPCSSFKNYLQKLFSIVIMTSVLAGVISVAAQTQRSVNRGSQGDSRSAPKVPVIGGGGAACKGGWSGVVKYSRQLDDKGSKIEPLNKGGKDVVEHKWSHNLSYQSTLIVDGSDPIKPRAYGTVKSDETRMRHGIEKTWGSCGAWKPEHWFVIDSKTEETETGSGKGAAVSFNLFVNEARGTYKMSFQFPDVPGEYKRKTETRRSGHCQEKNNEPRDHSEKGEIDIGGSASVDEQKIDKSRPDVLEGSVTIDKNDYNNPNNIKTPITKISWMLRRCPPPLVITDVKFYHLRYPSPSNWEEIKDNGYTIDGNDVKIEATIVNLSGARKSATVNFKELKENADLPQGQIPAEFEPHEVRTIEYVWNTSGYAWRQASPLNQLEINRQIEVKIPDDRKTEEVEVRPKPVIVVPGIWAEGDTYTQFKNYFAATGGIWNVTFANVDADKVSTDNAAALDQFIRRKQTKENAWHVDLVAHFSGGLTARVYVNSLMPTLYNGRPAATHLILVGVPNLGTPCATGVWGAAIKLKTLNLDVISEMSPDSMSKFNLLVVNTNGTRLSAIAGNYWESICSEDVSGDKIVPKDSAIWRIKEHFVSGAPVHNRELLGDVGNYRYIYQRLAVPPKGNHAPDTTSLQQ